MAKMQKSEIIKGLQAIADKVTLSVEAQSIVDYTVDSYNENARNVTMEDVQDAIKSVQDSTGKKFGELLTEVTGKPIEEKGKKTTKATNKKVENQTKPVIVPKTKKQEVKQEEIKIEEVEPKEDKTVAEVKEPKKSTKKVEKPHQDYLDKFPDTLESKSLKGTLKRRPDLVTIQDVVKAYNNDEDIVIATYWTKKLLKQYAQGYDPMGINPNRPKSFEHDLDLIEITYAHELVITGCSLYSIVPQILVPADFEQDEDGMRYANGCEFEVYEVVSAD